MAVCSFLRTFHSVFCKKLSTRVPFEEKTSGVKEPCSTSSTRSLYCLFFSFSFISKYLVSSRFLYFWAERSKTLIAKNARWPVTQKLTALKSTLASFLRLLVASRIRSPSNSASISSILTSLHTSFSRLAVMFLTSLCRSVTKPPRLQDKAWFTSNFESQTQVVSVRSSAQLYLNLIASRNSCFVRSKPWFFRSREVNQLETPFWQFSWALLQSCCDISAKTESNLTFWFSWRTCLTDCVSSFLFWIPIESIFSINQQDSVRVVPFIHHSHCMDRSFTSWFVSQTSVN